MPIISKETWDKLSQEEKTIIQNRYRYYNDNNDSRYNREIEIYNEFFGKENLQPQPLTYEDVARELFLNKKSWYINTEGQIHDGFPCGNACFCQNMCTSRKQAEKLLAINRLLNVAKLLNGDWKPDWEAMEEDDGAWSIGIDGEYVRAFKSKKYMTHSEIVYFPTGELANKCVAILGKDTVRLALTTEY